MLAKLLLSPKDRVCIYPQETQVCPQFQSFKPNSQVSVPMDLVTKLWQVNLGKEKRNLGNAFWNVTVKTRLVHKWFFPFSSTSSSFSLLRESWHFPLNPHLCFLVLQSSSREESSNKKPCSHAVQFYFSQYMPLCITALGGVKSEFSTKGVVRSMQGNNLEVKHPRSHHCRGI